MSVRRLVVLLFVLLPLRAQAENGSQAWLRYAALDEATARRQQTTLPGVVVSLGSEPLLQSAQREIVRGVRGLLGRTLRVEPRLPGESAILIGTLAQVRQAAPQLAPAGGSLLNDAFWLKTVTANGIRHLVITGENERGVLYGTFAYLRRLALGEPVADLDVRETPAAPIRWVNEWNNLDGTIERGYGGAVDLLGERARA